MMMLRRASEKRLQSQVARDPKLSVDRDFDATNVCDNKTWMERLELVEQGLSKLRSQLWLTVAD